MNIKINEFSDFLTNLLPLLIFCNKFAVRLSV